MDYQILLQQIANTANASNKIVGFQDQAQRARYGGDNFPNVVAPSGVVERCRAVVLSKYFY